MMVSGDSFSKNILIPKCNLHTHTSFCDGENTAEELVLAATQQGMETLGFSGHAFTSFDPECSMSRANTERYRQQILRLKKQYQGKIEILLGIEQDYFSDDTALDYDFIIGSLHYFLLNGEYVTFDLTREETQRLVGRYFDGDYYRYCRHYYDLLAGILERTHCDIVGHFDLVTKFNGDGSLFDESDRRYLHPAIEALDVLLKKDAVLEVNTAALVRGYRREPYPAVPFLQRIIEKGGRVTLSSDAHCAKNLLAGFGQAVVLLASLGFREVWTFSADGWRALSI